jgi:hypothetical protein
MGLQQCASPTSPITKAADIPDDTPGGPQVPTPPPRQLFFPRESTSSVQVEMMFSPLGRDATSADDCRGLAYGSAFFYRLDSRLFLVTARHNLTGRHWQTNDWLGSRPVSPTHLRIAWLTKPPTPAGWQVSVSEAEPGAPRSGSTQILMAEYLLPLIDEELQPTWLEHPQLGGDMDVGVLELNSVPDDVLVIPWENATQNSGDVGWQLLAPGQDVFILGYPFSLSTGPRFPLWMRGTIASHPGLAWEIDDKSLPLLLVDARTRKGQSGAAVIRHRPDRTLIVMPDGSLQRTIGPLSEILGVYSGRTNDESDLGFVWALEHVDVICRQGVP